MESTINQQIEEKKYFQITGTAEERASVMKANKLSCGKAKTVYNLPDEKDYVSSFLIIV